MQEPLFYLTFQEYRCIITVWFFCSGTPHTAHVRTCSLTCAILLFVKIRNRLFLAESLRNYRHVLWVMFQPPVDNLRFKFLPLLIRYREVAFSDGLLVPLIHRCNNRMMYIDPVVIFIWRQKNRRVTALLNHKNNSSLKVFLESLCSGLPLT